MGSGTFTARLAGPAAHEKKLWERKKFALACLSLNACFKKKLMNATSEWSIPDTQPRAATPTKNEALRPEEYPLFRQPQA
jgi:hypothetical protein